MMSKRAELFLTQKAMHPPGDAVAKVFAEHQRPGRLLAVWRKGESIWMPVKTPGRLREALAAFRVRKAKS